MHYVCTTCFTNDVVMPFNNGWLTAFDESKTFFSISFVATGKNVSYTFEYGKNWTFVIVHIWHETLNGQQHELSLKNCV